MTITMSEQKIQQGTAYLYEKVQLSTDLTVEDCEGLARGLQGIWQDTEEATMGNDGGGVELDSSPTSQAPETIVIDGVSGIARRYGGAAVETDPTPASQAPQGGDLYGAT